MPLRRKKSNPPEDTPFRLPGPREFGILEILWQHGALSVAEIRALMPGSPPLAYTTVMTMLDQLHRKHLVDRWKIGRAFQYAARVQAVEVRRMLAAKFLANYFGSDPGLFADSLRLPPRSTAGRDGSPSTGRRRPPSPRPRPEAVPRIDLDRESPVSPAPPDEEEDDSYLL